MTNLVTVFLRAIYSCHLVGFSPLLCVLWCVQDVCVELNKVIRYKEYKYLGSGHSHA